MTNALTILLAYRLIGEVIAEFFAGDNVGKPRLFFGARLLRDDNTYVYLCGLKGMEHGVEEAFTEACRASGLDWSTLRPQLLQQGRYHVETC